MINEAATTEQILTGCKAGNRKAQETLYRSFYEAMMNLCLRYTKNDMDAMEALNTGFYKVFKNIHQYNPETASLYTWIRTIVINSCIDLAGINKRKLPTIELSQAEDTGFEPEVFSRLSGEHLLQLTRQLPTATQTVFNLYVMEGYAHTEIATMLSITVGTSKWHVSDARKKLKILITAIPV